MKPIAVMLRALILSVLLSANPQIYAADLNIYLSTNGNDNFQGLDKTTPVVTLQRALDIAENTKSQGLSGIRISLQPGTYRAQRATTKGHFGGVPITLTNEGSGRVTFDGDGKGGTWLTVRPLGGEPSKLKIKGLEITNYETAINVVGNRNNSRMWAGGIEIDNNIFHKIGDIARVGAKPSTAVIRLVNSDKNIIKNNKFKNIKNTTQCALLHSLYIAHESTDNIVEGNTFEDSCGDSIRFRDRSDNNIVRNNTFIDAWSRSPVSDWFCNPKQRDNCTKSSGECPSSNLTIEENRVISNSVPYADIFVRYGGKAPDTCFRGMGSPKAKGR